MNVFIFPLVQWIIYGQKICDCGVKYFSSAPTKMPTSSPSMPASNNFNVTIDYYIYNLRAIATTNVPTPLTRSYVQRTYAFTSGGTNYYFRVPIAGYESVVGLPIGSWDTDFWQGEGAYKLGFYDPNSWLLVNGSFQVSYVNGVFCAAVGANRQATARFVCSKAGTAFTYAYTEHPICSCKFISLYDRENVLMT